MQIEDNLTLISTILENGDTIVIPSDGVWGLSCDARDVDAVRRINEGINNQKQCVKEVIVGDIPMLKKYVCDLHPRIETLLYYHERPIRVRCRQKLFKDEVHYMRIVKDQVSRILLSELGFPLYFVSFLKDDHKTHQPLQNIKIQDHSRINFIASQDNNIEYEANPLLRIAFDKEGMIKVLK
ncbi:Sua5/YciO/YrdC/YwlC family protein [Portibacter marinus]|uniref:Sua5/YciO/YrdC/YwlC family protein n=1 Tax=Portibacter marinus TaxID=2898660 RepID=UPI001F31425E|nr:Sua5/YciO/YrdC/YwlC family protein [Portibacter marinus]